MSLQQHIAKHVRGVYFGGNFSDNNIKDTLSDVTWEESLTKVHSFNTIAILTYHLNYFVKGVSDYIENGSLEIRDKYSFDHPPINSQQDWDNFLAQVYKDGEHFAQLIEQMPEDKIWEDFWENKYGNYYSNLIGITEHLHYHLGQIVLIKKILSEKS